MYRIEIKILELEQNNRDLTGLIILETHSCLYRFFFVVLLVLFVVVNRIKKSLELCVLDQLETFQEICTLQK